MDQTEATHSNTLQGAVVREEPNRMATTSLVEEEGEEVMFMEEEGVQAVWIQTRPGNLAD
jgi:hypothetical protein